MPATTPTKFENRDRKSTRLNSSHLVISYAVFCLKKKPVRPARPAGPRSSPGAFGTGYTRPRAGPGHAAARRRSHPGPAAADGRRAVFFFNDTATTEIYTLSLHDALPI